MVQNFLHPDEDGGRLKLLLTELSFQEFVAKLDDLRKVGGGLLKWTLQPFVRIFWEHSHEYIRAIENSEISFGETGFLFPKICY